MAKIDAFSRTVTPPAPEPTTKNIGALLYEDADKFAEAVASRAEQVATKRFGELSQQQAEQANVVGRLYKDFPELADANNPYTKAVLAEHSKLPESRRNDPRELRLIALETAADMEILPASKRKSSSPEPDVYGGGRGREREVSVDNKTLEFAKLLNLDVSDPKVVERLKERAKTIKRG
jgi:hypothetical protein